MDTLWDVANIGYDIRERDWTALGVDVACAAVPFLPAGITKAVKVADNVQTANRMQNLHEAARVGREVHKAYEYPAGYVKEFVLPSGKRIDAIADILRPVIELKPNNPAAIRKGTKQLGGNLDELNQVFGPGWTGEVWTY